MPDKSEVALPDGRVVRAKRIEQTSLDRARIQIEVIDPGGHRVDSYPLLPDELDSNAATNTKDRLGVGAELAARVVSAARKVWTEGLVVRK